MSTTKRARVFVVEDEAVIAIDLRERLTTLGYGGGHLLFTVSAGVAEIPRGGGSPEALLRAADAALGRAKREGRDRVCAAEPGWSAR